MLAACPAARESEDLGPREGVPHALRSVSESAADSAAVEALEQGGLARNPSSAVPRLGSQVRRCGSRCQGCLISVLAHCCLGLAYLHEDTAATCRAAELQDIADMRSRACCCMATSGVSSPSIA